MKRIVEPELMDDVVQAQAYAQADFDEPHTLIMNHFVEQVPPELIFHNAIDLGCGSGDISVRLAKRYSNIQIDALDGSKAMLRFARHRVAEENLASRIDLIEETLPTASLKRAGYDLVISNSLLHHLHFPQVLWDTISDIAKPGAFVFVADLIRAGNEDEAKQMVEEYAGGEPPILQRDFYHSLLAAFSLDEVKEQLKRARLDHLQVTAISNRHQIIYGRL